MSLRTRIVPVSLILLGAACGGSTRHAPAQHTYYATASIGDFLVITTDQDAKTMVVENRTRDETSTVHYAVAADGGYQITDSSGKTITAYEIPGFALVLQGDHMGPNHDQPALILAVERSSLAKAELDGRDFNFLQFRTKEGGIEAGHVRLDTAEGLSAKSYYPAGAPSSADVFKTFALPPEDLVDDPALGAVRFGSTEADSGVIFGTPGGFLAIDNPNGSIFGWPEASSKGFDPAHAGRYKALLYDKDAVLDDDDQEVGTAKMTALDLEVTDQGHLRALSGTRTVLETDLVPFQDSPLASGLGEPCHGLFVFQNPGDPNSLVFVVFMDQALALAAFTPGESARSYHYTYGVALTNPSFHPIPPATNYEFKPLEFHFANTDDIDYLAAFGIPDWSGPGRPHSDIDLRVKSSLTRSTIVSPTDGTIERIYARTSGTLSNPPDLLMLGVDIRINDEYSLELNFEPSEAAAEIQEAQVAAIRVVEGQEVKTGDVIGDLLVGTEGYPHIALLVSKGDLQMCPYLLSSPAAQAIYQQIVQDHGGNPGHGIICVVDSFPQTGQ